jgi:hypothetical protein
MRWPPRRPRRPRSSPRKGHTEITPTEAADRLAIRELFDAYAHCADRRDAEGQKSLFTGDTHFVVCMEGEGTEPTQELSGREALTPVFDDLNRYEATTHFNGQSTVALDGDRATGESYCLAHHLFTEDGERKLMVASLRYLDTFVKTDGSWLFAERKLYLDWTRDAFVASLALRNDGGPTFAGPPRSRSACLQGSCKSYALVGLNSGGPIRPSR